MSKPRLTVIAGPNGSGKSTIYRGVPKDSLGIYVNPDEIAQIAFDTGRLDFSTFGLEVDDQTVVDFFLQFVVSGPGWFE